MRHDNQCLITCFLELHWLTNFVNKELGIGIQQWINIIVIIIIALIVNIVIIIANIFTVIFYMIIKLLTPLSSKLSVWIYSICTLVIIEYVLVIINNISYLSQVYLMKPDCDIEIVFTEMAMGLLSLLSPGKP